MFVGVGLCLRERERESEIDWLRVCAILFDSYWHVNVAMDKGILKEKYLGGGGGGGCGQDILNHIVEKILPTF